MHEQTTASSDTQTSLARLGPSHGYRIDGDSAALNAEIQLAAEAGSKAPELALQLWACDAPYQGGELSGFKVAETPVCVPAAQPSFTHEASSFARPPADARDYAMVMVLAEARAGSARVFDFANFPFRQRFAVPHFAGIASYELLHAGRVQLRLPSVLNPRARDNLSGTLEAQLWALSSSYRDGAELSGTLMARVQLGQLGGQCPLEPAVWETGLTLPEARTHQVVLTLCEWTAQGYLVRDYQNFAVPYGGPVRVEPPARTGAPTSPPRLTLVTTPSADPAPKVATAKTIPIGAAKGAESARPSLNQVGESELADAAGLSKKLAADLVKARPFKSFDEIRRVRGIGDKTVQRLRQLFRL